MIYKTGYTVGWYGIPGGPERFSTLTHVVDNKGYRLCGCKLRDSMKFQFCGPPSVSPIECSRCLKIYRCSVEPQESENIRKSESENVRKSIEEIKNSLEAAERIFQGHKRIASRRIREIQDKCPHHNVTYYPDPSGNNDSCEACDDCGFEAKRIRKKK